MSTRIRSAIAFVIAMPAFVGAQERPAIWMSPEEIAALPTSGGAWEKLFDRASEPITTPVLNDLHDRTNITVLAKALVYARTGDVAYYNDVKAALLAIINSGQYAGEALPLARRLGAYVIAADVVDFEHNSPVLHNQLKNKLRQLRNVPTFPGPTSLVDCHEKRLNNAGTAAGFTRLCIDLYVDDEADLARAVEVWKGWMGDTSSYASFDPGDLSWQADPANPVGINKAGATIQGHNVDGVLPDEQRDSGPFTPPPYPCVGSIRGALQGALCAAVILERQGIPARDWSDAAILRAGRWFTQVAGCPLVGDDRFETHLFNHLYPEMNLPITAGVQPGKLIGFTDWTHGPWATTGVNVSGAGHEGHVRLTNASPNPFADAVTTQLSLERPSSVLLRIVDVRGRAVVTLHDGRLLAGAHHFRWDGRDRHGRNVAPGTYFVTANTDGSVETRRIVRLH
jgi:hypothetical protein